MAGLEQQRIEGQFALLSGSLLCCGIGEGFFHGTDSGK